LLGVLVLLREREKRPFKSSAVSLPRLIFGARGNAAGNKRKPRAVDCRLGCGKLSQHVGAIAALLEHANNASELTLSALEPALNRLKLCLWNIHEILPRVVAIEASLAYPRGYSERNAMKLFKTLAAALIALFAVTGLSGCTAAEALDMGKYSAVIDVRTVEEWNQGHLEGAVRMGIADADFRAQLETLDLGADYFIYCRSGNRAGQAIDIMRQMGFSGDLINGGSVANAAGLTGLAVNR
jgi:phage shock protein E